MKLPRINYKKGLIAGGLLGLALIGTKLFGHAMEMVVLWLSLLLITAIDPDESPIDHRIKSIIRYTIICAIVTPIAIMGGETPLSAILLGGGMTWLTSILMARGKRFGMEGYLVGTWFFLLLSIGGTWASSMRLSSSFLVGGGLYTLTLGLIHLRSPKSPPPQKVPPLAPQMVDQIRKFAIVKTVAVVFTIGLGWLLLNRHPLWMSNVVFFMFIPTLDKPVVAGVTRAFGTALGVVGAIVVMNFVPSPQARLVIFLVGMSMMVATQGTVYSLYLFFMNLSILLFMGIQGAPLAIEGTAKILTNLMGVGIAWGSLLIWRNWCKQSSGAEAPPVSGVP
ncbi:FUSC family protein [Pontibacter sp. G13]|uniref:FUSC family protein n=1 Tax=Pontibacter sp. G13 TaxID=3074898 RepID=UPI00288A8904|nr:FUSC family protein [Pontibacter sp. G13]WNJ16989.1 FUSC family protein [Pontibacter sp. G13]